MQALATAVSALAVWGVVAQSPAVPGTPAPASAAPVAPAVAPAAQSPVDAVRTLLLNGAFPEAERTARAWLAGDPDNLRAAFYLGLVLHKSKRHGEAVVLLERSAAAPPGAFPESAHAIHYLGWCRYYLGDLAGARLAFEAHAQAFPQYDDTQFALGLIAYEEDRLPDAEARFRRALELLAARSSDKSKELAKNHARLGDVLLRQSRLPEAEQHYRRAVQLWPTHGEAWSKLARVLDREGRPTEADAARAEQARIQSATERTEPVP